MSRFLGLCFIISSLFLSCYRQDAPTVLLNQREFTVGIGGSVIIDGSQSFSTNSEIKGYYWDVSPEIGIKIENMSPERIRITGLLTGDYRVFLQVRDANEKMGTAISHVKVIYLPQAVINAPKVAKVNKTYTLVGEESFDYHEKPLEYMWSIVPSDAVRTNSNNKKNIQVQFFQEGIYTVSLSVSNSIIKSITKYKTIVVSNKPVAYIDAPEVIQPQRKFYLSGVRSRSPDNTPLNFSWQVLPKEGMVIHDPHAIDTSAIITKSGTYTISLQVDDGEQFSDRVDRIIKTNNAPVAVIDKNVMAIVGETVTIHAAKSYDPDGDELKYYWKVSSSNGATMQRQEQEEINLHIQKVGKYTVTLRIYDKYFASDTDSITFTSVRKPVAHIPEQLVVSSNTRIFVDGSKSFSHAGNTLDYEWDVPPGLRVNSLKASMLEIEPISEHGVYNISLRVHDGYNYSAIVYTHLVVRDTHFVDVNATGKNTGHSWTDAYTNLQDAIRQSGNESQIWVADGTYIPATPYYPEEAQSKRFVIMQGVQLYGGFSGNEQYFEERNPQLYKSILSGDIYQNDSSVSSTRFDDNAHTIIHHIGRENEPITIIDGFYIQNAYSPDPQYVLSQGHAVYTQEGSLRVSNVHFTNNRSGGLGSGIYNYFGSVEILNSIFTNNTARSGSAIYSMYGGLMLYNSRVINNSTTHGAAIFLFYGQADIVNCIISANRGSRGGAIYSINSTVNITNATIVGNEITGGIVYEGSALFSIKGVISVFNSIIYGNKADGSRGIFSQNIFNDRGNISYRSSLIEGWSAREKIPFQTAIGDTILDQDPKFRRMPNISGETDALRSGDVHLLSSSPAINAGDTRLIPRDVIDIDNDGDRSEFLPIDLAGNPREHPEGFIDLGALENIY